MDSASGTRESVPQHDNGSGFACTAVAIVELNQIEHQLNQIEHQANTQPQKRDGKWPARSRPSFYNSNRQLIGDTACSSPDEEGPIPPNANFLFATTSQSRSTPEEGPILWQESSFSFGRLFFGNTVPFRQNDRFVQSWQMVILFLLLYTTFVTTYEVGNHTHYPCPAVTHVQHTSCSLLTGCLYSQRQSGHRRFICVEQTG
jgi:hypothetical protein